MVKGWKLLMPSLALGSDLDQAALLQVQRKSNVQRGTKTNVQGASTVWVRTCSERKYPGSALDGGINIKINDEGDQKATSLRQGWMELNSIEVPDVVGSVAMEATEKDPWCFDQVLIGLSDQLQLFHIGAQWLSTACDEVSVTPCTSSVNYLPSDYGADVVRARTVDSIPYANSNGHFYISINNGPEYLLDSPKNDFEGGWDQFYIPAYGGDVVETVDIHCRDTDGWAFDALEVDGQLVHKGTQWLDNAKVEKNGENVWGDKCPDKKKSKTKGYKQCLSFVSYTVEPPKEYGVAPKGLPCQKADGWLPVLTQAQCKAANTFLKDNGLEIGEVKARAKEKNPPGCYYLKKGDNAIHAVNYNKAEHDDEDAYWDKVAEMAKDGEKIKFGAVCYKLA